MSTADLQHFLHSVFIAFASSIFTFILYCAIFSLLAYFFAQNSSQPFFRKNFYIDLLYFFGAIIYFVFGVDFSQIPKFNINLFSHLHTAFQVIILIVVIDFIQYWIHRLTHHDILWNFHIVHHSSEDLDWLSGARWHPINYLIYIYLVIHCTFMLGFSKEAIGWFLAFYGLNGHLVHANVNWTYGPLRYVFASPVFHRWHHTEIGCNKNYAPYLACYDLFFGTFYMPKDVVPQKFGVQENISDSLIKQLLYPFRRAKLRAAK